MKPIDIFPLLSVLLGIMLGVFVLLKPSGLGVDRKIRYVMAALVFLYTFIAIDYYLIINTDNISFWGISYFFFHLTGFLLYYFSSLFSKNKKNLKTWTFVIVAYSLFRGILFYPLFKFNTLVGFFDFVTESNYAVYLACEYYATGLLNFVLIFLSFIHLKKVPEMVRLNRKQELQYRWIKFTLSAFILLQFGMVINEIISELFIKNYQMYFKVETLFISLFFFIFAYSLMHFPVFTTRGYFEGLPEEAKQKYAGSSLADVEALFNRIHHLVVEERLYLDYNVKLNTLSEKLSTSVNHISQSINQCTGKSFPDFMNEFRVEEAKRKLLLPNPDTILAISLDVGFNSKAAFYAAFKKATQQTPSEFKKSGKA